MKSELAAGAPAEPGTLDVAGQRAVLSAINWRLIPLLFFCYVIAYVDRINLGFAKLHLREVLGVNEAVFGAVYGLGAGLFFIGYFLFEVPSNLMLQRVGARIWIARIMIVWGLVSMAMMFIKTVPMFYAMRFLLGAAEAGFFPGVILYLTYWYPAKERARTDCALRHRWCRRRHRRLADLGRDPRPGRQGWPRRVAVALRTRSPARGDHGARASLHPPQRAATRGMAVGAAEGVASRAACRGSRGVRRRTSTGSWTWSPSGRVWLLCLLYFLMNIGSYGYELWLPSIIKSFSGKSDAIVGWINAIPYVIAAIVMLLVGRYSDRTGERRGVVAAAAISSAVGFALSALLHQSLSRAGFAGAGLCRDQIHHRPVLGAHDVVPHGPGRRGRHRADQFGRQSRWLRRALRRRHDQGSHGQQSRRAPLSRQRAVVHGPAGAHAAGGSATARLSPLSRAHILAPVAPRPRARGGAGPGGSGSTAM